MFSIKMCVLSLAMTVIFMIGPCAPSKAGETEVARVKRQSELPPNFQCQLCKKCEKPCRETCKLCSGCVLARALGLPPSQLKALGFPMESVMSSVKMGSLVATRFVRRLRMTASSANIVKDYTSDFTQTHQNTNQISFTHNHLFLSLMECV
eukprot:TRINITY_DN6625_c0_g1_i1.p1 TRINITY_DN6625_c0_g1~~TRINITY_DN6625_c0_g1_i1.p1  ORF type:complete len:151 (-),score=22.10 TRINITY_DN6625_c0_g1_i1:23-475(-)